MSACVGIDLSSFALDLVKLDEDSNRAEWVRCELSGKDAWERTLSIHESLHAVLSGRNLLDSYWSDVYLVALEAPYGRGQAGTNAILNRVVGAVAASLPAALRSPERCWIVRPDEWKGGLGLKDKPTWGDVYSLSGRAAVDMPHSQWVNAQQNFRDAYCLALFARDTNARAVARQAGLVGELTIEGDAA